LECVIVFACFIEFGLFVISLLRSKIVFDPEEAEFSGVIFISQKAGVSAKN